MAAHKHDCESCVFLGTTGPTTACPEAVAVDHYEHSKTLIQRYGSEGPDYLAIPLLLVGLSARSRLRWMETLELLEKTESKTCR